MIKTATTKIKSTKSSSTVQCKGKRKDGSRCENHVKGDSYCRVHQNQMGSEKNDNLKIKYTSVRRKTMKVHVPSSRRSDKSMQCLGTKQDGDRCHGYGTPNETTGGVFYICVAHLKQKPTIEQKYVRCKETRKDGIRCRAVIERNSHESVNDEKARLNYIDYICLLHQMKK